MKPAPLWLYAAALGFVGAGAIVGFLSGAPVTITTTGEAPAALVTEEEYAAREAARAPAATGAQDTGTTVVKDERELTAALEKGGDILIPGGTLTVSKRIVPKVKGTRLRGNGAGNTKLGFGDNTSDDRLIHPIASDCSIENLTLSGGPWRSTIVNMDGLSRGADRFTFRNCNFESCGFAMYMSGGPLQPGQEQYILEDFQVLGCRFTDFDRGAFYLSWEMLRTRIQDFTIIGNGIDKSDYNGIWIGLGLVDSHILNGTVAKVGRIGIEIYYAHGTVGGPGPALVSLIHPNSPSLSMDNIVVSETGSMGISLAGTKRCNIGKLSVRNTKFIGVEFVDEDKERSDYNVTGPISVRNHSGWGISIDQIKGGHFRDILVNGVTMMSGCQWGMQVYKSDDVTFTDSTFTDCGARYILHNQSTRCHYLNNHFVSKPGEAWPDAEGGNFAMYAYAGEAYFSGNVLRGNATNPLRVCVNGCAFSTSPTSTPTSAYNPNFDDPNNYRGRQFKATTTAALVRPSEADKQVDVEAWKKENGPKKEYPPK
jgi:hypothetical protein